MSEWMPAKWWYSSLPAADYLHEVLGIQFDSSSDKVLSDQMSFWSSFYRECKGFWCHGCKRDWVFLCHCSSDFGFCCMPPAEYTLKVGLFAEFWLPTQGGRFGTLVSLLATRLLGSSRLGVLMGWVCCILMLVSVALCLLILVKGAAEVLVLEFRCVYEICRVLVYILSTIDSGFRIKFYYNLLDAI